MPNRMEEQDHWPWWQVWIAASFGAWWVVLFGKIAIEMSTGDSIGTATGPNSLIAAAVIGYVVTAIIQARRGK